MILLIKLSERLTRTGRASGFAACSTMLNATNQQMIIPVSPRKLSTVYWYIVNVNWNMEVPFPPKLWPTNTLGVSLNCPTCFTLNGAICSTKILKRELFANGNLFYQLMKKFISVLLSIDKCKPFCILLIFYFIVLVFFPFPLSVFIFHLGWMSIVQ